MRRAASLAVLLPVVLSFAGCLDEAADVDEPAQGDPTVPFRVLESGSMSEMSEPVRAVFDDPEAWSAFYRAHAKQTLGPDDAASPPRPPEVDFSEERAVAVTLGDKGNSCWAVRVTNATLRAGVTTLTVTTYAPPPETACAQVVTQPYTFVAIPRDGSEVAFEERTRPGPPPGA